MGKKFSESIFRILNKLNKYWGIYKAKIILEGKKGRVGEGVLFKRYQIKYI